MIPQKGEPWGAAGYGWQREPMSNYCLLQNAFVSPQPMLSSFGQSLSSSSSITGVFLFIQDPEKLFKVPEVSGLLVLLQRTIHMWQ